MSKVTVNRVVTLEVTSVQAMLIKDLIYSVSWDESTNDVAAETEELGGLLTDALEGQEDFDFTFGFEGNAEENELTVRYV